MILELADEDEGDEWAGYVSVRVIVDGEILLESHVAPEWIPDLDEFTELARIVSEVTDR